VFVGFVTTHLRSGCRHIAGSQLKREYGVYQVSHRLSSESEIEAELFTYLKEIGRHNVGGD
jgi:hypothetical protein